MEKEEKLKCPKCGCLLEIDSIRKFKDGKKRVYWECERCNLSVMDRNPEDE